VLLPCRHLVACKECALNMVEFGAGGNITQAGEGEGEAAVDEGANPVTPSTTGTATATATAIATANNRRKRKAKGWFCPVCRQPYTSMLRITTNPPPQHEHKEGEGSGTEDEGPPTPTNNPVVEVTEARGLLGSALRPGFLRGLSRARSSPGVNPDVENQVGLGHVGA